MVNENDIIVANVTEYSGYHGEYIGRGTPLGSPFVVGVHGTRDECVDRYAVWLDSQGEGTLAHGELKRLLRISRVNDLYLLCHCAPRRCHGDVIRAKLESMKLPCANGDGDHLWKSLEVTVGSATFWKGHSRCCICGEKKRDE